MFITATSTWYEYKTDTYLIIVNLNCKSDFNLGAPTLAQTFGWSCYLISWKQKKALSCCVVTAKEIGLDVFNHHFNHKNIETYQLSFKRFRKSKVFPRAGGFWYFLVGRWKKFSGNFRFLVLISTPILLFSGQENFKICCYFFWWFLILSFNYFIFSNRRFRC